MTVEEDARTRQKQYLAASTATPAAQSSVKRSSVGMHGGPAVVFAPYRDWSGELVDDEEVCARLVQPKHERKVQPTCTCAENMHPTKHRPWQEVAVHLRLGLSLCRMCWLPYTVFQPGPESRA